MIRAYYNEFDPYCAEWLRNLIAAGHLPPGDVDDRSITEVSPDEIREYDQWHFFAGIGGWALAARLAGIGESSGVLTGSPPCQPFSSAGKRQGYADDRHLAPVWLDLVAALRPAWVFGEQVAAAIKKDDWLDDLLNALEGEGYATGAVVFPACGVGAPHIRQRLWVVARMGDSEQPGLERHCRDGDRGQGWPQPAGSVAEAGGANRVGNAKRGRPESWNQSEGRSKATWQGQRNGGVADACGEHLRRGFGKGTGQAGEAESQARQWQRGGADDGSCGRDGGLADTHIKRHHRERLLLREAQAGRLPLKVLEGAWGGHFSGLADACDPERDRRGEAGTGRSGLQHAPDHRESSQWPGQAETGWNDPDWLYCRDGKWRPVESSTFPLADGVSARVGRLRAYGNAIVPEVAAEVIREAVYDR